MRKPVSERLRAKVLTAIGDQTMTIRRAAYLAEVDEHAIRDLIKEKALVVVGTQRDPLAPRISKPLRLVKAA